MKITPEMIENYDYIKCRVCGKYYKSLTRHVICKHDMDPDEYKETFDVDYIFCGRLREEIAEWGIKHSFSESGYVPRNKKQVVTELKKYKARHKPLERALLDRKDRSLLFQVYHIFGDLETLKEETGIVIEKVEKEEWSKDKVLEEIRHLHKKGIPLSHRSIKQADSKLLSAANRHFGSSRKAVEAAGFDAPKVEECKQWDKQKVIEGIKEYHKKSISLNTNSINRVEKKLYQAAQRHFGSWGKAVKAAGFDAFGVRKFKQWDKSKVIKAIPFLKEAISYNLPL